MMENDALFEENFRWTKARFFFIVEIALHTFVINYPVFVLEIYTYGVLYAIGNVQKTVQRLYLVEP